MREFPDRGGQFPMSGPQSFEWHLSQSHPEAWARWQERHIALACGPGPAVKGSRRDISNPRGFLNLSLNLAISPNGNGEFTGGAGSPVGSYK